MVIPRTASETLATIASQFKAVAIIGPRQSGKTTLSRLTFDDRPYVSLEDPDTREFAHSDPRRFLAQFQGGAIFDEVQRVPELFSYLQGILDGASEPGRFVLTGSHHFGLMDTISQSLAGRVGFIKLLPFSFVELKNAPISVGSLETQLFKGGYPPIYDMNASPELWYNAYIASYIERDIRLLVNVQDIGVFQRFMRMCAANVGQMLNMTRMGADLGIDQKTVRAWMGILETSFIVFRLMPHHANFRKRLVKTPKLYFYDTGLAARLLGIEAPEQLVSHTMRGALFENWVITELVKYRYNRGKESNLFFWRNNTGHEVDIIADLGESLQPIEVKSGTTIARDWFDNLVRWRSLAKERSLKPCLVYGGKLAQTREQVDVIPWNDIDTLSRGIRIPGRNAQ
jgi:uncharacterized protein